MSFNDFMTNLPIFFFMVLFFKSYWKFLGRVTSNPHLNFTLFTNYSESTENEIKATHRSTSRATKKLIISQIITITITLSFKTEHCGITLFAHPIPQSSRFCPRYTVWCEVITQHFIFHYSDWLNYLVRWSFNLIVTLLIKNNYFRFLFKKYYQDRQ